MRFFLFILLSVLGVGCSDVMAPISSGASPCQATTDCEEGQLCSAGACLIQEARCDLDGLVEPGEACDDGNQEDDDSCRGDCQIARCGDGIRRTDRVLGETGYEACDDGNQRQEDACANNCQNAFCGDGILRLDLAATDPSWEACDDGNRQAEDGCTNDCRHPRCGDAVVQDGEACDDGNDEDGDSCTSACALNICGDGLVLQGQEACDDGNDAANDACDECRPAICGDGIRREDLAPDDPGFEACDDGNDVETDACLSTCQSARCGDGQLRTDLAPDEEEAEQCDDGNGNAMDGCRNDCRPAECGDGLVRADLPIDHPNYEVCDDGNDDNEDACLNTCVPNRCGDGFFNPSDEGCDDGNLVPDDACTSDCRLARCGDGVLRRGLDQANEAYEGCDDGNQVDNDACRNNCQAARCGDGVVRTDLDSMQQDGFENCEPGIYEGLDFCRLDCRLGPRPRRLALKNHSRCLLPSVGPEAGRVWCWGLIKTLELNREQYRRGPLRWGPEILVLSSILPTYNLWLCGIASGGGAFCYDTYQHDMRVGVLLPAPAPLLHVSYGTNKRYVLTNQGQILHWNPEAPRPLLGMSEIKSFSISTRQMTANFAVDQAGQLFRWVDGDENGVAVTQAFDEEAEEEGDLPPMVEILTDQDGAGLAFLDSSGRVGVLRPRGGGGYQFRLHSLNPPAQQIARGDRALCARLADGSVHCLGSDGAHGCLGRGAPSEESTEFRAVTDLEGIVEIAGDSAEIRDIPCGFCARNAADEVWCWGANYQDSPDGIPANFNEWQTAQGAATFRPRAIEGLPTSP